MNRKHLILITAGAVLWFVETTLFGFNLKPESGFEALLDSVSLILIGWGIIGDILSGLTITKYIAAQHKHMQSDKLFLEIKKGATISFGGLDSETTKNIELPLTAGIKKGDKK